MQVHITGQRCEQDRDDKIGKVYGYIILWKKDRNNGNKISWSSAVHE
jgi:hypothetical protein